MSVGTTTTYAPSRKRRRLGARPTAAKTPQPRFVGLQYLARQFATGAPLLIADIVALAVAYAVAMNFCWVLGYSFTIGQLPLFAYLTVGLICCNAFFGLYPAVGMHSVAELRQAVISVSATVGVFAFAFQARNLGGNAKWLLFFLALWSVAVVGAPLLRAMLRRFLAANLWWAQPTLIVGDGPHAESLWNQLMGTRYQGLRPLGFVSLRSNAMTNPGVAKRTLGSLDELAALSALRGVYRGVVAMSDLDAEAQRGAVDCCVGALPHVILATNTGDMPSLLTNTHSFAGGTGLVVKERLLLPLPRMFKRCMDLAIVLLASVVLLPLVLCIAIAIRCSSPGPIFYRQRRLGSGDSRFWAWKFRSMVSNADDVLEDYLAKHPTARDEWERDHKLKNDPRITRVGRLLRRTSLDELPQLWNVLRGEMSLVGPRPIVEAEISKYDTTYQLYMRVRPGITGLWQISGRNDTTYEERVRYDGYYARNWSPWLDIYILVRTIKVVAFCEGAY